MSGLPWEFAQLFDASAVAAGAAVESGPRGLAEVVGVLDDGAVGLRQN